nr:unnamed protein product [Naegleria fowleri]
MVSSSSSTKNKSTDDTAVRGASSPKKITKKNSSPSSPSITLAQPLEATLSQVLPKQRKEYTIQQKREKWSEEEHEKFLEAIRIHGRDWKKVEDFIGTKTRKQIRSHAQKHFEKMKKNGEEFPKPRAKRKSLKPYPSKKTNEIYNALSNDQIMSNLKKIPNEFFEKLISHHDVSETIRLIHLLVTASATNDDKDRSAAVKNFSEKERNLIRTVIHNATNLLSSSEKQQQESTTTTSTTTTTADSSNNNNNHHLLFLTSLFTNFTDLLSSNASNTSITTTDSPTLSPCVSSSQHVCSSNESSTTQEEEEILVNSSYSSTPQTSTAAATSQMILPAVAFDQGMIVVLPGGASHIHQPSCEEVADDGYGLVFSSSSLAETSHHHYCVSPTTTNTTLSESDSSLDEFSPSLCSADDADDEKMTQLISDFTNRDHHDEFCAALMNPNHQQQPQFCTILPSPFSSNFYATSSSSTTPALYIPPALHLPHSDQAQHLHLNPIQMNHLLQNSLLMMNVVVEGGSNFENLLVEHIEPSSSSSSMMNDVLFDDSNLNVNSFFETL